MVDLDFLAYSRFRSNMYLTLDSRRNEHSIVFHPPTASHYFILYPRLTSFTVAEMLHVLLKSISQGQNILNGSIPPSEKCCCGPQLLHLRRKNVAKPKKRAYSESNLTLASLSSSLDRNRCGRVIGSLRFRPAEGPFRNSRSLFAIVALAPTDCVRSKSVGGCVVRKPLATTFIAVIFDVAQSAEAAMRATMQVM